MIDSITKPPSECARQLQLPASPRRLQAVADGGATSSAQLRRHGGPQVGKHARASINGIAVRSVLADLQVDTASVLPVSLGTNDYSLTLQTALGIGRPMPPPQLPRIKKNNGIQAGPPAHQDAARAPAPGGHVPFPHDHPGGHARRASWSVNANVKKNNNYKVQITTPQSVGVHEFRVQAVDDVGHVSSSDHHFLIKVVPKKS